MAELTPFVVLDTETTGLEPGHSETEDCDRVLEIAGCYLESVRGKYETVESFETLINPQRPVDATIYHKITDEDVEDAPIFSDIAWKFAKYLDGKILVAQKKSFEENFLSAEFGRCGFVIDWGSGFDTKDMMGGEHLQDEAHRLGISVGEAHTAWGDVKTTVAVMNVYRDSGDYGAWFEPRNYTPIRILQWGAKNKPFYVGRDEGKAARDKLPEEELESFIDATGEPLEEEDIAQAESPDSNGISNISIDPADEGALTSLRAKLLDLTSRNPLISYKFPEKRSLHTGVISDSGLAELHSSLTKGKAMRFVPGGSAANFSPDNESISGNILDLEDGVIASGLSHNNLEKRHSYLYREAKHAAAEKGVNNLFLAFGFLYWKPTSSASGSITSPLLLMPVVLSKTTLDKKHGTYVYQFSYSGEDIIPNISLYEKILKEANASIPLPSETSSIANYLEEVNQFVEDDFPTWEVHPRVALGLFPFGKDIMYKDLDPERWENEEDQGSGLQAVWSALYDSETAKTSGKIQLENDYDIDNIEDIYSRFPLIVDADASQHSVVIDALRGENLAIQGPPGAGKSQTIQNIIAGFLAAQKTVLFVAQKQTALEVVKTKMDAAGLGDFCLELHSNKSNKRAVWDKISSRMNKTYHPSAELPATIERLQQVRDKIQKYAEAINSEWLDTGKTVQEILGAASYYQSRIPIPAADLHPEEAMTKTGLNAEEIQDESAKLFADGLSRVAKETEQNGGLHPWAAVSNPSMTTSIREQLRRYLIAWTNTLEDLSETTDEIAAIIGCETENLETSVAGLSGIGEILSGMSALDESNSQYIKFSDSQEVAIALQNHKSGDISIFADAASSLRRVDGGAGFAEFWDDFGNAWNIASSAGYALKQMTDEDIEACEQAVAELSGAGFMSKRFSAKTKEAVKVLESYAQITPGQEIPVSEMAKHFQYAKQAVEHMTAAEQIFSVAGNINSHPSASVSMFQMSNSGNYRQDAQRCAEKLSQILTEENEARTRFVECGNIDEEIWCGTQLIYADIFALIEKNNISLEAIETLHTWSEYLSARFRFEHYGFNKVITATDVGLIEINQISDAWKAGWYNQMALAALEEMPAVERFSGSAYDILIEEFRELEQELMEQQKQQAAYMASTAHSETEEISAKPKSSQRVSDLAGMDLIKHESKKQTRHIALRQVMERSGSELLSAMPCFMMSPMSVSQYLPAEQGMFDLVIMDEASQIETQDALGVLARGKKAIVVGDSNQLPPTNFFKQSGTEEDPDDEYVAESLESILDLASTVYKTRMLKYHYRSQHHSLIDFSNRCFYGAELMTFPSPTEASDTEGYGVSYKWVGGVLDDSKNEAEAEAIVEYLAEASASQETRTYGVVAMNINQQRLLEQKIEEKTKTDDTFREWINSPVEETEGVFIKNLESVQGDERDVILISVTYAPTEQGGSVPNRFGPINSDDGWRRLNVLLTRARQEMVIFASMKDTDVNITETSGMGLTSFKDFLAYSEHNTLPAKGTTSTAATAKKSLLAEAVAEEIRKTGTSATTGTHRDGYVLDIAAENTQTGQTDIGIELDGHSYMSGVNVRDRDRIRPAQMQRMGWNIQKIWATDFFRNPTGTVQKISQPETAEIQQ